MDHLSSVKLKKHAAAIHCSGELSLVERKLSNILLLNAYDNLTTKDVHTIPARYLFTLMGWSGSNNVEGLKATLKNLMSTVIEFNLMEDGGEVWQAMTLLSSAKLSAGECRYSYAKDLAEKFYKPEIFAIINITVQKQFKSNYALTLYENCVRFVRVGSTGWWDLKTFRKIMGATSDTYDEFKRLSSFVIKKAIDEINTVSDIRVTVEYRRVERKVVSLRFLIISVPKHTLQDREQNNIQADEVVSELKETELFKRLRDHGIGEKLALSWITEEPDLAAKAVDYTENQDDHGRIKGSTAGYIRRLIESKAQIDNSQYNRNKTIKAIEKKQEIICKEKTKILVQRKEEYQKYKYQQALKSISENELLRLKDEFLQSDAAKTINHIAFNSEKGKFVDKIAQITFLPWLKNKITPNFDEDDFNSWLKIKT